MTAFANKTEANGTTWRGASARPTSIVAVGNARLLRTALA